MTSSAAPTVWRWAGIRRTAPSWTPPALPTTVVVPHPDDEVLMFGGLLRRQARRASPVHVIAVTDGDAAYEGVDRGSLAAIRRDEQREALRRLGVDAHTVTRLSIPDGEVAEHVEEITDAIEALATPVVAAPWFHDHHTDHEACGRAALTAAARTGAAIYYGLFWSWSHTDPELVSGQRLIHLGLDAADVTARRWAMDAHRSQVTDDVAPALLDDASLASLAWSEEFYLTTVAPAVALRPHLARESLVRQGCGQDH